MAKKRPKWSTNVAQAMKKKWYCPVGRKMKSDGTMWDEHGVVLRTYDCHDSCPLNGYRSVK